MTNVELYIFLKDLELTETGRIGLLLQAPVRRGNILFLCTLFAKSTKCDHIIGATLKLPTDSEQQWHQHYQLGFVYIALAETLAKSGEYTVLVNIQPQGELGELELDHTSVLIFLLISCNISVLQALLFAFTKSPLNWRLNRLSLTLSNLQ